MTHKDIYIKFMIEYDKANVTSSYPSLTEYEVATVLDKAYNALIAQKITGNNPRRSQFESDVKSISDLRPLITRKDLALTSAYHFENPNVPTNVYKDNVPEDMLYFVAAAVSVNVKQFSGWMNDEANPENPQDGSETRLTPAKLVTHQMAELFYATSYNIPWVKNPVCFLEDQSLYLVTDPIVKPGNGTEGQSIPLVLTYIKKPNTFVKDLSKIPALEISDDTIRSEFRERGVSNIDAQPGTLDPDPDNPVTLMFTLGENDKVWYKTNISYFNYDCVISTYKDFMYQWYHPDTEDSDLYTVGELESLGAIRPGDLELIQEAAQALADMVMPPESVIVKEQYIFELDDVVAGELITLAVAYALENVESPRFNNHLQMRSLEA